MNKEELELKLEEFRKEYLLKRKKVCKEYALSNNPYKIGDIIEDHYHIVKIEEIRFSKQFNEIFECVYYGTRLTKKLVPTKRQFDTRIFQSNVEKKHEI